MWIIVEAFNACKMAAISICLLFHRCLLILQRICLPCEWFVVVAHRAIFSAGKQFFQSEYSQVTRSLNGFYMDLGILETNYRVRIGAYGTFVLWFLMFGFW